MKTLTAIDPGARTGWACFIDGVLIRAGVASSAKDAIDFSNQATIIERPVFRRYDRVDPNDLLALALRVGWLMAHAERAGANVELVDPGTWKGSVPKIKHHPRILAALSSDEREVLPLRPRAKDYDGNMLDAVGIGLWKLGRLK